MSKDPKGLVDIVLLTSQSYVGGGARLLLKRLRTDLLEKYDIESTLTDKDSHSFELSVQFPAAARERLAHRQVNREWRCFHCDALFMTEDEARHHFGPSTAEEPICQITAERYRQVERELWEFRNESDATTRTFFENGAKAQQMATDAEQKGYDRGIADAKAHPGELGLTLLATVRSVIEQRIQELVGEYGSYDGETNITELPDNIESNIEELETLLGVLVPKQVA